MSKKLGSTRARFSNARSPNWAAMLQDNVTGRERQGIIGTREGQKSVLLVH